MKKLLIILAGLSVLNCSTDEPQDRVKEISPITIGKHFISNSVEQIAEQRTIIVDSNEWNALLSEMGESQTENISEVNIDFEQFMILAVFDKNYSNFGHTIDIIEISEFSDEISVTVDKLLQGNDLNAFCQPYHIVKIPKTDKPIVFEAVFDE